MLKFLVGIVTGGMHACSQVVWPSSFLHSALTLRNQSRLWGGHSCIVHLVYRLSCLCPQLLVCHLVVVQDGIEVGSLLRDPAQAVSPLLQAYDAQLPAARAMPASKYDTFGTPVGDACREYT